jgi:hypothetical protein
MRRFKFILILLPFAIGIFPSCSKYFKAVEIKPDQESQQIISAISAGKYFILRDDSMNYAMNNVSYDRTLKIIRAQLGPIDPGHTIYLKQKKSYSAAKDQDIVLDEIHLYTNNSALRDRLSPIDIPLSEVKKIEQLEFDKKKTANRRIVTGAVITGVSIGFIAVVGVLVENTLTW